MIEQHRIEAIINSVDLKAFMEERGIEFKKSGKSYLACALGNNACVQGYRTLYFNMNRLFVYGSLVPGGANEHILRDMGGEFEKAYVTCELFNEGWGSDLGYPGIRVSDEGERIEGYVFSSNQLGSNWKRLDDFEGEAYSRVLIKAIILKDNSEVEAYIYELK